jgi:pimeloyl-ACP methyl ester carboxylesterase
MRWIKRLGLALGAIVLVLALAIGFWALLPAATPEIDGPNAIAALERVPLGGVDQTILVRGHDRSAPVLLYLHGGPGGGQLPIARYYSALLEEQFVVVNWDQRGAGASCEGLDHATLSLDSIVEDTIELSEQLAARFGGNGKIVLLGHSWGSVVGALAAQRRPDLFHAYVGLGQLVHGERNEQLSYEFVVAEAKRRGDEEGQAAMATISPPWADNAELSLQRTYLNKYDGSIYAFDRARPVFWDLLFGREYTLATRLSYLECMQNSLGTLWAEVGPVDFENQIPRLEVPVVFLTGRHDWNTPYPLVEEWAATLDAPSVEIVWFEDAGHMVPVESPQKFQRALIETVLPLTR